MYARQNDEKKGLGTLIMEGTTAARQGKAQSQGEEIFQAQVRGLVKKKEFTLDDLLKQMEDGLVSMGTLRPA